ncbi:DinB family protein [Roseivirga sp. BDSF3-8]|uniref:DinB family protein n=1 Tax=Roseivirga sp. BDSF3-8 TaxID=3241598 RepID=UPI0035320483
MKADQNKRPEKGEYNDYYHQYVTRISGDTCQYLERQGESFATLINSVPEDKWDYRYAEGKWSIRELIGHILDGERIFVYRALAIARGEKESLPGFDENAYVANGRFAHRSAESFYKEFINIRQSTLDFYRYLDGRDWDRSCVVNGHPMTVRAIAYIIGGHLAHHMEILSERYLD